MTTLTSLIERIEAATKGSRELDGDICLALGWTFQKMKGDSKPYYRRPGEVAYYLRSEPPAYSTSIDAARSIDPTALCVFASDIGADGLPMVKVVSDTSTSPVIEHTGIAATLELAWCAATLRARQTEAA